MLESKQKGLICELQCITFFYQQGYQVSIPYGENSRYDFIVDINGKLIRVQCKTSHEVDIGVIKFSCRSSKTNSSGTINRIYTKEEIDYFCTFYNNICYLIPINECSVSKMLRFIEPNNNQKVGISYAKDYEAEIQIEKIKGK